MASKARRSAVSMPSPSRSNFTSPASAQSSLSHCSTVRPGMVAHSTGQTSMTGRSHSTMPPEWMPRCRGRRSIRSATSSDGVGDAADVVRRGRGPPVPGDHLRAVLAVVGAAQAAPPLDALRPRVLLADVVAEGPGGVAHRRAGPVGDDVGHLGGVLAAVALVDELDDLLAPAGLDVEVDVRRARAPRGEEALEEQPVLDGVHGGDAQGEADRGVGRRPPALAQDVPAAAELDDLVDDEEVAGEVQLLDDLQLVLDHLVGAGHPLRPARAVALGGAAVGQLAQPRRLGVPGRDGVRGQVRRDELEVEGAPGGQRHRRGDGVRVAVVPGGHLRPRAQVGRGGGEPAVDLLQARAGAGGGQDVGEHLVAGAGAVHRAGGHQRQAGGPREVGEGVVARGGQRPVLGDLHGDVVPPEQGGEPVELGARGPPAVGALQRLAHRALAAAGEHQPVPVRLGGEVLEVVVGPALGPRRTGAPGPGRARGAGSPPGRGPARGGGCRRGPSARRPRPPWPRRRARWWPGSARRPARWRRPRDRAASARRTTP